MGRTDVDVLIVGAGVSGIGVGCQVAEAHPNRSIAILERRQALGGTWDLFRYPGIRCDSDMYTFGYSFRPWARDEVLTDGDSILAYLAETAAAYGIDEHIHYGHHVQRISWSTDEARWTVTSTRDDGSEVMHRARFLVSCTGYYDYDNPHQPEFPGVAAFEGDFFHPQQWPDDVAWKDRKVVIIGSGATAVTLVPAMADECDLTMLQRSPTYVVALPEVDRLSRALRRVLPDDLVSDATRMRNLALHAATYKLCRMFPRESRWVITRLAQRQLGDVDIRHFTPTYDPWDQRICAVPNGDLFRVFREHRAEIVTDHIETFTPTGIQLRSGRELEADVVISATGLRIQLFGGVAGDIDGEPIAATDRLLHRSIMVADVPNFAFCFGYTNVSWTRKVDLVGAYVARVLTHMDRLGMQQVTPRGAQGHESDDAFVNMNSGYLQRAADQLPRQGDRPPWRVHNSLFRDWLELRHLPITDPTLHFDNPVDRAAAKRLAAVVPLAAVGAVARAARAVATSGRLVATIRGA